MMRTGAWHALQALAVLTAVLADWRLWTGADFAWFRNYLRQTPNLALNYPCTGKKDCGCRHGFMPLGASHFEAVCQCGVGQCPPVKVALVDVMLHEVDVERLAAAIGRALGLGPAREDEVRSYAVARVWLAGTYGARRALVFLALCVNEGGLLESLNQLASKCGEPFILLVPTARLRSEAVALFLQRQGCKLIPLAPCVAGNGAGELELTHPIAGALEPFGAARDGENLESGTRKAEIETGGKQPASSGTRGRLRYENDFMDIWFGEELYDLRERTKARLCIQYLFEKGAFDKASARHFEREIDPYVRRHSKLEPLPDYAETKLHHYFNPSTGKFARLGRELIRSAGRGSGRYFLNVL